MQVRMQFNYKAAATENTSYRKHEINEVLVKT